MKTFKTNPIALAISLVAMSSITMAAESEKTNGDGEEVIVTGFRASTAKALDIKKESVGAVDSIVAEDIGKFPDNNLADSMARLPGVNIDRTGGEGKTISVRGLSPQFSRIRVNGMETIAAGYANKSRSFDFNIFASELFNRIDVSKTMRSELDEGSLGATVDMYTTHPLDSNKDVYMIRATEGFNDLSKSTDPRLVGLASIQNEEGTLGAAVSLAYSNRNVTQEGHNSGRWEANAAGTGTNSWKNAASLPAAVNAATHPRFPRQMDRDIETNRLGATGSLQWKPTEKTKVSLDILHAQFDYDQADINLTPISLSRTTTTGRKETTVNSYELDTTRNALVYADLSGVDVRSENFLADTTTKFHQVSLAVEQSFTDSLTGKLLIGSSKSNTEVTHEETAILEAFNQNLAYDYRGRDLDPKLTFGFDLTNPSNWKISELRDRPAYTTNTFENISADLKWEINDVFSVQGGLSSKKFMFDIVALTRDTAIINQTKTPQGSAISAMPAGCNLTIANTAVTSDMGHLFTPSNGQNTFFLGDINKVFGAMGFGTNETCFPLKINTSDDRTVEEKDKGYYVQGNFSTEIGSMPFKGNFGVRQVTTDVASTGLIGISNATVNRSYKDNLPSLNLMLAPIEDVTIRASWAKVMSRPDLGNLTPGGSLDNFNRKYTAGNPYLNPFRAKASDISVDWYFAEESLLSLAYFKKDIDSFPQNSVTSVVFSDLGLSSNISPAPATATDLYTYTSKSNGEGGSLDGFEIQYQQPFNFGPDWLHNFGTKINVTKVTSKVNVGTKAVPVYAPLVGQSDHSSNATLWYANNGFEGRVSYTYRSSYITASQSVSVAGPGYDTTDAVGVVDAAFSYKLNDNLKFTLDMINLNNTSERTLLSYYRLLDTELKSGRQFYLGVSYSF